MVKYILNFAWLLCLIGFPTYGQTFKIDTAQINKYLDQYHDENQFDGIALMAYKDSIIYKKTYGYANNALKMPFNLTTKFQIASLSKQFTAFGILILEQENKLKTEDYVYQHLPNFPFKAIKIKHLMNHTSGLPNFVGAMWKDLDTTKVNGNKEMLLMLESKKYPLQWHPGSKWEYSDIGYCTLASVIEKVSGKNFKAFMNESIFKPAGMTNTSAELSTDYRSINDQELAMGYIYDSIHDTKTIAYAAPENSFIYWLGGFYGDGSVVSTVEDLLKWDQALSQGDIIHPESLKKAMTPTKLNNGEIADAWGTSYGLGWFLYNSENFGNVQSHSGGHPGYSSRMTRCPDVDLTIILLSNLSIPKFWNLNLLKELEKQQ
ncbi:serine hydrolase domain-containing protein [Gelidibacter maritimus]|uniref:Beta-lactamase family protein n=1 Tax=Gelidibacter maritimus TaxID=2761487 RepID=A0A7W2M8D7_9FLAO|nr:serine hydrolase domain-containing protein [Gelidibacter maritimus]MBA6154416.1 beta-lactamase family protein [Gelidibacter maritimus]